MNKNPFTPTFGSEPMFLVGRETVIEDILEGLENGPGDPNRSTIIVGPRGSGKTVLLAKIANEAQSIGCVFASVTAVEGMLEDIVDQLLINGAEFFAPERKSHITGAQVAGVGFAREIVQERRQGWRARVARMLDALDTHNVGLLITVDEVNASLNEMVTLTTAYQHFVTEKRNVALVMAGLPGNISQMMMHKKISYLRKAFQRRLDPIPFSGVQFSLKRTIEASGRKIGKDALVKAARYTDGFPFLIQLVGYHVWRQSTRKIIPLDDVENGYICAEADMEQMILGNTVRELSAKDIAFLLAMRDDEPDSLMGDIAARLKASPSLAGQYRLRLIDQGVISDAGYGKVRFEMPMMREYLNKYYPKG
jgi:hypothetical protein